MASWYKFFLLAVLGSLVCSTGVGTALGESAEASRSLFLETAKVSTIDDSALKPWHLKLSVEPAVGSNGESMIVEEWWAGPARYRIAVTSASYTAVEVRNAEGVFHSGDSRQFPEVAERMRMEVVHPMPSVEEIESSKLMERGDSMGKLALDCVMVGQEIRGVSYPPLGLFPTYCMDRGTQMLRVTFDFGSLQTARMQLGTFQERKVAVKIGTLEGGKPGATAKVEALSTMPESAMDFVPPAGGHKQGDDPAPVSTGVMQGLALAQPRPRYPEGAKQRHVSGTVVMSAVIGRDGRVHSLKLKSYGDGELAVAALAAVRQWTYKPYLLNDEASEVSTTITVNFNIGPG